MLRHQDHTASGLTPHATQASALAHGTTWQLIEAEAIASGAQDSSGFPSRGRTAAQCHQRVDLLFVVARLAPQSSALAFADAPRLKLASQPCLPSSRFPPSRAHVKYLCPELELAVHGSSEGIVQGAAMWIFSALTLCSSMSFFGHHGRAACAKSGPSIRLRGHLFFIAWLLLGTAQLHLFFIVGSTARLRPSGFGRVLASGCRVLFFV